MVILDDSFIRISIKLQILIKMERKDYTPTKTSKLYANQQNTNNTASSSYLQQINPNTRYAPSTLPNQYVREPRNINSQATLLRELENYKLQNKQLQITNRHLSTQNEKLKYQKNMSQSKFLQKINFEEETISQFQKQKNYQIELLKIKNEEEINKIRREYEMKVDDLVREIKNKDYQNRESIQKMGYVDLKNLELKKQQDILELELSKVRENNSILNEALNKEEFANKKLEMLVSEIQRQKLEMQNEIHVLLDIEAEKSRNINSLEIMLRNAENTERNLKEKLDILTDNFANLEEHISVMKERMLSCELKNDELEKIIQCQEMNINDKENLILEQKDREMQLREQLEQHQMREVRREKEVNELMVENQRLYKELNFNRHKLHEVCIAQGIDI